ncbi:MAG: 50S ribosomal protein L33 [Proteobacteria bacterium]|nr:50S ribosomal protein L33 [Pseudomonadota bacterium]
MAKKRGPRATVKLVSSAGTGHCYYTQKNSRNSTEKMKIKKFDPIVGEHVEYSEGKMK